MKNGNIQFIKKTDFKNGDMLPRFIFEYANYKLTSIYENDYTRKYYLSCVDAITKTIKNRGRGLITIDETITSINDVLNNVLWEDIKTMDL